MSKILGQAVKSRMRVCQSDEKILSWMDGLIIKPDILLSHTDCDGQTYNFIHNLSSVTISRICFVLETIFKNCQAFNWRIFKWNGNWWVVSRTDKDLSFDGLYSVPMYRYRYRNLRDKNIWNRYRYRHYFWYRDITTWN